MICHIIAHDTNYMCVCMYVCMNCMYLCLSHKYVCTQVRSPSARTATSCTQSHAAAQLSCLVFLLLLREFSPSVSASLAFPERTSHKAGIQLLTCGRMHSRAIITPPGPLLRPIQHHHQRTLEDAKMHT